jgi:hypothetical protein
MEKLWWWIVEFWDFNLSTETAHAKLRRIDQLFRCPVQSSTIKTYDIHISHIMNSPIWVKWLTGQGQRRLDRGVGRIRGIDSWMRYLRLCNRKIRRRRRGIGSQMRYLWSRKNGMGWWKDRKRHWHDIYEPKNRLRDLWIYWNWSRSLSLKRWQILKGISQVWRQILVLMFIKMNRSLTSTSTLSRGFRR